MSKLQSNQKQYHHACLLPDAVIPISFGSIGMALCCPDGNAEKRVLEQKNHETL